ncbi:DNA topology modulation protein [Paenibacillus piri]|uniref:DNA topology modulation protein n=1 Tax=Paenibacillus piri TaxID=2547395 RepID=A0A4R5K8T2_9BACL|nr:DNA topology modulation protein [Paenibacillus piri]TDF91222.1 DNA topology modulation protein [Paenibacillus piri]
MKKIALIGSGGSGKSTLARKLGAVTKLPVYHLDALHWKPGWVPTPNQEWDALQRDIIRRDEWIIDGNYGRTLNIRLDAADTIIFFDLSRWVTMYRIFKRRIMYHGKTRPDLNEGCPEQLDMHFIKWIWNFKRDKRPAIIGKLQAYAETTAKTIVIIKKPSDADRLLRLIEKREPIGSSEIKNE